MNSDQASVDKLIRGELTNAEMPIRMPATNQSRKRRLMTNTSLLATALVGVLGIIPTVAGGETAALPQAARQVAVKEQNSMAGREYPRMYNYAYPPTATTAADMTAAMANIQGLGDAFDAARTGPLPDGRWLTLTGDATEVAGQTWPVFDNAAIIWDVAGQRRVESTQPGRHFFPRWDDGSEFWPNQFFVVGNRGYVIGSRQLTSGGSWTAMGAYGAVFDVPENGDPSFLHYFPTPSSLCNDVAVQWYGAMSYDGTYVYIHGVKNRPDVFNIRDGGYVARVSLAQLEVPHRWKFWNGTGWVARNDLAVSTLPTGGAVTVGTSSGYTLHKRPNGQWQVTTKLGDIVDGIHAYRSANPWGPWTKVQLVAAGDIDHYLAGAAPGIPTVSGNLLVQLSRRNSAGSYPEWYEVAQ